MSNFKLNLPTDIPWERICVTEDMIDPKLCDARTPAKWQTSMAVFKYRPAEEYQLYPGYTITYLKVTATLTGYQPLDSEIQGTIDWDGVNVSTIPGLTDLLNSYNPCHGAILQVLVGPHGRREDVPLSKYPFFMDFEPKKRELYEIATDTKEKQSRSIESLNVTKSSGTTQSMEILDVDMGGGGGSAQGSYAGTGGGFSFTLPNGQWGTKRLNAEEGLSSRSTDVGSEKRETFSFSTQISQMYHLLDSYHLGTNRVVFFVQPRPHTLEEPSGFVRGPRPVEGIQEFFLVVAQPKDQDDFCVSLRLDTSHLTKTPIMDFDRKSASTSIATANAPVATDHDIPAENIVGAEACFFACWDVHYQCYRTQVQDNVTFDAPPGYSIESFNDLINEATHGSTNVVITPNRKTLNINAEASGHICYEGSEVCVDCPDTIQAWAGHARRQVQVNLISETPIKQIGEEENLMITTRGLCCCANELVRLAPPDEFIVSVKPVPAALAPVRPTRKPVSYDEPKAAAFAQTAARATLAAHGDAAHGDKAADCGCGGKGAEPRAGATDPGYTIRQANELSNYIKTETLKSLNDPTVKLRKFIDTDFFATQLEKRLRQTKHGREMLRESAAKALGGEVAAAAAKYFKRDAAHVSVQDVLAVRTTELAKLLNVSEDKLRKRKLKTLGIVFKPEAEHKKPKKS